MAETEYIEPTSAVAAEKKTNEAEAKKKIPSMVRKPRHTNRSRLNSAIKKIAKDVMGNSRKKAPISTSAVSLLEDMCSFLVRRVSQDASRILEKRSTISLETIQGALKLNIRNPKRYSDFDAAGKEYVNQLNANKSEEKEKEEEKKKVRRVIPGFVHPHRVERMLRKSLPGHPRVAASVSDYMAGVLNSAVRYIVEAVHKSDLSAKAPKRLGINDFYNEIRVNLDLNAIVPYSMIARFGGDKDVAMPRKAHKRTHEDIEAAKKKKAVKAAERKKAKVSAPPKKKARVSAPPKKKAKKAKKSKKSKAKK